MDKFLILSINDVLMNPYCNICGEYDSEQDAISSGSSLPPSGPNNQYIVVKKGGIDSVGNAKTVKIVHLF